MGECPGGLVQQGAGYSRPANHSRASFCASAIWAGLISDATMSRTLPARSLPCAAADLGGHVAHGRGERLGLPRAPGLGGPAEPVAFPRPTELGAGHLAGEPAVVAGPVLKRGLPLLADARVRTFSGRVRLARTAGVVYPLIEKLDFSRAAPCRRGTLSSRDRRGSQKCLLFSDSLSCSRC